MKKILLFSTILGSLLFTNCDKIEDYNLDPNRPEDAPIYTLLKAQIITTEQRNFDAAYYWGGALAQQTARTAYTDIDRYKIALGSAGNMFTNTYRNLVNLRVLESRAQDENNLALLGTAQVLEAFQIKLLTDMYGNVPYSEAAQYDRATGKLLIAKPKYDTQEEIYTAIINLLKTANNNLAEGAAKSTPDVIGKGDYLFNQNINMWRKFCNSLLIRTYIQISNVNSTVAATGISDILSNPSTYPIISNNSDNVVFKYLAGADKANWNPLYVNENDRPSDYGTSESFIEHLKAMSDPRLGVLASTTSRTIGGVPTVGYWGYPNGAVSFSLQVSDYGPSFRKDALGANQARPNIWMSYAEILLYLAEARERGLITSGVAQTYYDDAVRANFAELGLLSADAATYLAASGNYLASADKLQLIYRELWVSTYLKGNQGWDLIRRVGSLGGLITEVASSEWPGLGIPTRLSYPTNEKDLNFDNWTSACNAQSISENNNYLFGKMWWQP